VTITLPHPHKAQVMAAREVYDQSI